MTVFEETFQEIDSFGKTFDETANKIRVLTEYVVSDYNVDVASVKLEQKKDDTISDEQVSESLYEVTEKCNGKLRKTANSINRNSQDYFSKMNASLQKITSDPSYQETIDKAGALCKEYPKLGKVQVTYHAYEEEAKAIAKGMDQLQTVISKGKARKNFTDADSARIDEILNDVNKARQAAGKKDNTVTLTEGVSLLSALLIALKNQTAEKASESTDAPVDSMSPESSRIMLKAIGAQKQLAKSNVAVNTRGALSLRNGIKKAIKQKKSLEKAEAKAAKETKESVEEFVDDTYESTEDLVSDLDAAALLESVFEDLHTEPTPEPEVEEVTESVEDLETSIENHMAYMSQLETEILGFESGKEETPEDDADKILEDATYEAALAHSDPGDTDGPTNGDSSDSVKESEEEPVTEGFKDAVAGAAKKVSTNAKIAAASAADALEDAPKNASKKMAELKSDAKHAAAGAKKAMSGAATSARHAAHNAASDVEIAAHKVANSAGNAATVAKIKKLIADGRYTQAKQALKTAQSSLDPKTVDSLVDQLKKLHDRFYESVDEDLDNMIITQESEEEPVTEEPEETPVEESAEDDTLDPEAMLNQVALESGIEPETTSEESVQESSEDLFDIDALLTEAALNAGIEPDADEVDALCEKYGVTIEESAETETSEDDE